MTTFQVRYKICCVKTWCLFSSSQNPCWTYVANSNGIVLLCHREKLPDRRSHVHRWWRNERDTSTCTRKADESQINQTDWLIDLPAIYFIGSSYRISFIYRSNKNDCHFHPYRSIIYLSDKYRASLSKMNTVWMGLDNIYGNILSHKMTWFTIQIQVFTKTKTL